MQLARHPAFLRKMAPLIKQHFGEQPALEVENLIQLYSRELSLVSSVLMLMS